MRAFYIILLLLWFLFGSWICRKQFCNPGASEAAVAAAAPVDSEPCNTKLIIKDGDLNLSTDNFMFSKSDFNNAVPSAELTSSIESLVEYLGSNTKRFIQITGYYDDTENNESSFDNLGLARADRIRSYIISKGGPEAQVQASSKKTDANCYKEGVLQKGVSIVFGNIPE